MLFMFFTISNWRWELSEENEVLPHIASVNTNVQRAALQDQVFRNPGSRTVPSERANASVVISGLFCSVKNVDVEQVGNDVCWWP